VGEDASAGAGAGARAGGYADVTDEGGRPGRAAGRVREGRVGANADAVNPGRERVQAPWRAGACARARPTRAGARAKSQACGESGQGSAGKTALAQGKNEGYAWRVGVVSGRRARAWMSDGQRTRAD
jgi:hypothetical protein